MAASFGRPNPFSKMAVVIDERPAASSGFPRRLRYHRLGHGFGRRGRVFRQGVTMAMYIGEALVGDGNEIAHIDLMIGDKAGPVGQAFANALANQTKGHTNLLAVVTPNVPAKPYTVMITKVTLGGAKQVVQMFGPAQQAVAKAVLDSVADGVIPKEKAEDLVCVCGVFIHWEAEDNKKIFDYNYEAVKMAIKNAMTSSPKVDDCLAKRNEKHPFAGF
jgi:5,6,7,8-tetrahydromethanopterin hydro-lyase